MEWEYLSHILLANHKKGWEFVFFSGCLKMFQAYQNFQVRMASAGPSQKMHLLKQLCQSHQATVSRTKMHSLPKKGIIKIPSLRSPRLTLWCTVGRMAQNLCMFKKQVSVLFCLPYAKRTYRLSEKCFWGFDEIDTRISNACEFTNAYFASLFLSAIVMSSSVSCSLLNYVSFITPLSFCTVFGMHGHNM